MTAAEYRAKAEQLRDSAKRAWVSREEFLRLAAIYETLAKVDEALQRSNALTAAQSAKDAA